MRLGVATAVALPVLVWLTRVSVDASLSVLGVDAFDVAVDLRGQLGAAVLLGRGGGWCGGAAGPGLRGCGGAGLGGGTGCGGGSGRGGGAG